MLQFLFFEVVFVFSLYFQFSMLLFCCFFKACVCMFKYVYIYLFFIMLFWWPLALVFVLYSGLMHCNVWKCNLVRVLFMAVMHIVLCVLLIYFVFFFFFLLFVQLVIAYWNVNCFPLFFCILLWNLWKICFSLMVLIV